MSGVATVPTYIFQCTFLTVLISQWMIKCRVGERRLRRSRRNSNSHPVWLCALGGTRSHSRKWEETNVSVSQMEREEKEPRLHNLWSPSYVLRWGRKRASCYLHLPTFLTDSSFSSMVYDPPSRTGPPLRREVLQDLPLARNSLLVMQWFCITLKAFLVRSWGTFPEAWLWCWCWDGAGQQ